MLRKTLVLLMAIGCAVCTYAQTRTHLFIGPTVGTMYYVGDLTASSIPEFETYRGFFGAEAKFKYLNMVSAKVGVQYGSLFAADSLTDKGLGRNFHFRTPILDLYVLGKVNVFNQRKLARYRHQVVPTIGIVAGAGFFHFNPQVNSGGEWISARDLGTEGQHIPDQGYPEPYSLWQPSIKFGSEMNLRFSDKIELDIYLLYTKTFTDYLDDVGGTYPNYDDIIQSRNGELTAAYAFRYNDGDIPSEGGNRGNPESLDGYFNLGVTLNYRLTRMPLNRFNTGHRRKTRGKPAYF